MLGNPTAHFRRDLLKLSYLALALLGTAIFFAITPGIATPALLSVVFTMILSPAVAALERRGFGRTPAILMIFGAFGVVMTFGGVWAVQTGEGQWDSFRTHAPEWFRQLIEKLRAHETWAKAKFPILSSVHPTDSFLAWGQETGKWFVTNGPALIGDILTWILLVPVLTFVFLNEGPDLRKRMFSLVPNSFFEIVFLVSHKVSTGISDYIRAKLLEAFLVGLMTTVGLAIVGSPYALVLGILAGVTNILPYLGPFIGAAPGILIAALGGSDQMILAVAAVYLAVNIVDMIVIFPIIVAQLVNLHPLILLAVVAVGQKYYGLIGMLISIPVATSVKVVLGEIYSAVYEHKTQAKVATEDAFESHVA